MTLTSDKSFKENLRLPSDLAQIFTVAKYDAFKHLRSKRLLGIVAIIALLIIVNLVLPPALGEDYADSPTDFASGFIGMMPTLIIIIATLFAGDAIVSEFQGRTGYLLFPNPVKRSSLYIGKMASAIGLGALLVALYYVVTFVLTFAVTGETTALLVWSMLLAFIYTAAAIAVGFMISSFMKGSTGALILTFALLFMILPMISGIMSMTDFKPEFELTFQANSVSYMLEDPYPVDSKEVMEISEGQTMTIWYYYPQPWIAAGVMSLYAVVAAALGYIGFKKREMVS
ncbi:MAG: ABC transporter permease subunit [Methanomassiliicoccales archaeon]|jgi:ABC-2 type transport system permease protein